MATTFSDFDIPDTDVEVIEYKRDEKVDEAKAMIYEFLAQNSDNVFYERQLAVIFENQFFHWITIKALLELVREGSINSELLELGPKVPIRFFRMKTNRYWRRQASKVVKLVKRFSAHEFGRAIGLQGEILVDAALPLAGFATVSRNANSFQNRVWVETEHNLDRIVERRGNAYGVEIKNTLPYIDRDEFRIKLDMCTFLGIRPLFIFPHGTKELQLRNHQARRDLLDSWNTILSIWARRTSQARSARTSLAGSHPGPDTRRGCGPAYKGYRVGFATSPQKSLKEPSPLDSFVFRR